MSVTLLQQRFLDMSAPYWRDNLDMNAIFYAQASIAYDARQKVDDILFNEFFTDTASDWGLRLKEELYGMYDGTERTLTERRGRIRARERGGRVATKRDLEFVAASFVGGKVDITPDYDNFVMTVEFVDTFGIPTRIADVQAALDKVFPAYWDIIYNFRFNVYRDIGLYFGTYQSLSDARLSYRQLLLTDQQVPSYIDVKADLMLELSRYVNESKSLMLSTGYLNYRGLN